MNKLIPMGLIVAAALSTGCSTVMNGSTDSVLIAPEGCEEYGRPECTVTGSGHDYATTGKMSIEANRGAGSLNVACQAGEAKGNAQGSSEVEPWVFGNILLGGVVGIVVDGVTGNLFGYPDRIAVPMTCPESVAGETNQKGDAS